MKKSFILIIAFLLVSILAGCSAGNQPVETEVFETEIDTGNEIVNGEGLWKSFIPNESIKDTWACISNRQLARLILSFETPAYINIIYSEQRFTSEEDDTDFFHKYRSDYSLELSNFYEEVDYDKSPNKEPYKETIDSIAEKYWLLKQSAWDEIVSYYETLFKEYCNSNNLNYENITITKSISTFGRTTNNYSDLLWNPVLSIDVKIIFNKLSKIECDKLNEITKQLDNYMIEQGLGSNYGHRQERIYCLLDNFYTVDGLCRNFDITLYPTPISYFRDGIYRKGVCRWYVEGFPEYYIDLTFSGDGLDLYLESYEYVFPEEWKISNN